MEIVYVESPPLSDDELNVLVGRSVDDGPRAFQHLLERSLVYVAARHGDVLVGFVHVATDGGVHAFLLDPTVLPEYRRRGIGTELIRRAVQASAARGAEWMHVDYEQTLSDFYRRAGFRPTRAGLIKLGPDDGVESDSSLDGPTRPIPSPFAKLTAPGLITQALIVGILAALVARPLATEGSTLSTPVAGALFYVGVLLVLAVRARLALLDVPRLFGPAPARGAFKLTLVAFPLCLLSAGGFWLLFMPVSYVLPELVHSWLARADKIAVPQSIGVWAAQTFVAVVMAPIVEEVLFRGLLMQRWALRWGTWRGIMASSALFAICHFELLGHFFFAVVMSVLYLQTRSLWVPIAAHALNNLIASLGSLDSVLQPDRSDSPLFTVDTLRSGWMSGALCLLFGLVLLEVYNRAVWKEIPVGPLIRGPVPYVR